MPLNDISILNGSTEVYSSLTKYLVTAPDPVIASLIYIVPGIDIANPPVFVSAAA